MKTDQKPPPSPLERLALWLTPTQTGHEEQDFDSHSLLVTIGLITAPFALLYVAVSQLIGFRIGVMLMLTCFVLLLVILAAFRLSGRFRLCANLYLACCFFVAILGCSYYSGGPRSMVLPWFALVPITSVLLFEFGTATRIWTLLTSAVVIIFGLAAMLGHQFPVSYDTSYTDLFNTACIVGLAMILSLIALVFGRNKSRAMAAIRNALRHVADARDEAEAANIAKSRFLAAASHDLRQPIQAMRLFQDTLSKTPLSEEQHRISDFLRQSTQSLADILNALLDVSKLDSGLVRSHPETVAADALFGNIEAEFAPLALAKGLRFKLFYPGRELALFIDTKLLHDVLRNLIDNALKYTQTGGILVGLRRRGGAALIQVWDTGIGIAPEHLEAIFDEYVQVDNPHRDRTKGLGLGLAIAQRLASILGSRIDCRSRPAEGSVFEISVPLADAPAKAAGNRTTRPAAGIDTPSGLAGKRMVVVEDDAMAAKALELALKAHGMAVSTFSNAEEALADSLIGEADFYISDFRLPGLNGLQLLDTLQERARRPIKGILLTGEISDKALSSSAALQWKVLFKPVDLAALVGEIEIQCLAR